METILDNLQRSSSFEDQFHDASDHGLIWVLINEMLHLIVLGYSLFGMIRFKVKFIHMVKLVRWVSRLTILHSWYLGIKFATIAIIMYMFNVELERMKISLAQFNCSLLNDILVFNKQLEKLDQMAKSTGNPESLFTSSIPKSTSTSTSSFNFSTTSGLQVGNKKLDSSMVGHLNAPLSLGHSPADLNSHHHHHNHQEGLESTSELDTQLITTSHSRSTIRLSHLSSGLVQRAYGSSLVNYDNLSPLDYLTTHYPILLARLLDLFGGPYRLLGNRATLMYGFYSIAVLIMLAIFPIELLYLDVGFNYIRFVLNDTNCMRDLFVKKRKHLDRLNNWSRNQNSSLLTLSMKKTINQRKLRCLYAFDSNASAFSTTTTTTTTIASRTSTTTQQPSTTANSALAIQGLHLAADKQQLQKRQQVESIRHVKAQNDRHAYVDGYFYNGNYHHGQNKPSDPADRLPSAIAEEQTTPSDQPAIQQLSPIGFNPNDTTEEQQASLVSLSWLRTKPEIDTESYRYPSSFSEIPIAPLKSLIHSLSTNHLDQPSYNVKVANENLKKFKPHVRSECWFKISMVVYPLFIFFYFSILTIVIGSIFVYFTQSLELMNESCRNQLEEELDLLSNWSFLDQLTFFETQYSVFALSFASSFYCSYYFGTITELHIWIQEIGQQLDLSKIVSELSHAVPKSMQVQTVSDGFRSHDNSRSRVGSIVKPDLTIVDVLYDYHRLDPDSVDNCFNSFGGLNSMRAHIRHQMLGSQSNRLKRLEIMAMKLVSKRQTLLRATYINLNLLFDELHDTRFMTQTILRRTTQISFGFALMVAITRSQFASNIFYLSVLLLTALLILNLYLVCAASINSRLNNLLPHIHGLISASADTDTDHDLLEFWLRHIQAYGTDKDAMCYRIYGYKITWSSILSFNGAVTSAYLFTIY